MRKTVRVACLYRVSTKAQLDRETDDIPMQQNACRQFAESQDGWVIVKEYFEKGVSGYKKTLENRDVLRQIKQDAENRHFDTLLVFMFDRLGRREDETPFVLEWFVRQGVAVWSVKEGQQRFDDRTDKLLNYIRFWQSGGESEKTGIRVKEKHIQMIKEGKFCGGNAPYGYRLEKSGMDNGRGRLLKKMVIDGEKSEYVRLIYNLAVQNGYGGGRIAEELNAHRIPAPKGDIWSSSAVNYILRNPIYMGYPAYGKTTAQKGGGRRVEKIGWHISEVKKEELQIIDESVWNKAEEIRKARNGRECGTSSCENVPLQTKSPLLLTGLVKCGFCGCTMCSYTSVSKWSTKSGEKRAVRTAYRCTSVARGIKCCGQITYTAKKIEEPVMQIIYDYIENIPISVFNDALKEAEEREVETRRKQSLAHKKSLSAAKNELHKLNAEIARSLLGESLFTPEQLSSALKKQEKKLVVLLESQKAFENVCRTRVPQDEFCNWRKEFDNTPSDIKKMLLAEIINCITVHKDALDVSLKISREDFNGL